MAKPDLLHGDVTDAILKSFYQVYNTLGYGFLEKVYENSMGISLRKSGHTVQQQMPIHVTFEEENVGRYFADLLVDNRVIIELKATEVMSPNHEAQLLNYLKATGHEVGLLLNFGPKAEFRRKVCTHR